MRSYRLSVSAIAVSLEIANPKIHIPDDGSLFNCQALFELNWVPCLPTLFQFKEFIHLRAPAQELSYS